MSITIANKGTDINTGLPLSYKRGAVTWDESAQVLFIIIETFITFPNGSIQNIGSIRKVIQDIPSINYNAGDIITPAVTDENGNITTPAIIATGTEIKTIADLEYTNYYTQFNFSAIGTAIDTYITNLTI